MRILPHGSKTWFPSSDYGGYFVSPKTFADGLANGWNELTIGGVKFDKLVRGPIKSERPTRSEQYKLTSLPEPVQFNRGRRRHQVVTKWPGNRTLIESRLFRQEPAVFWKDGHLIIIGQGLDEKWYMTVVRQREYGPFDEPVYPEGIHLHKNKNGQVDVLFPAVVNGMVGIHLNGHAPPESYGAEGCELTNIEVDWNHGKIAYRIKPEGQYRWSIVICKRDRYGQLQVVHEGPYYADLRFAPGNDGKVLCSSNNECVAKYIGFDEFNPKDDKVGVLYINNVQYPGAVYFLHTQHLGLGPSVVATGFKSPGGKVWDLIGNATTGFHDSIVVAGLVVGRVYLVGMDVVGEACNQQVVYTHYFGIDLKRIVRNSHSIGMIIQGGLKFPDGTSYPLNMAT